MVYRDLEDGSLAALADNPDKVVDPGGTARPASSTVSSATIRTTKARASSRAAECAFHAALERISSADTEAVGGMAVQSSHRTKNDNHIAVAIAWDLTRAGHDRMTARELRDRFGRTRLTAPVRDQITAALRRAGVALDPPLDRAGLDEELVLHLVRRTRREKVLRAAARGWKGIVAVLGLVGTLVGLYAFLEERLSSDPSPRLADDLNIAVAPFTAGGGAEAQAERLGRQIRTTLGEQLERHEKETGITFGVAPPPAVEPVASASGAEDVATDLNADVVVYGRVRVESTETVVVPSFFISAQALGDAEELVGDERLGAPVTVADSVADSVAARIQVRRVLAARARTLADFVVGLSFFRQREYGEASEWFRRAEASSDAAGGDVREVMQLFLGHVAGRTGELERAERAYRRALETDPGYARARFGLAEVRFQRAHGGCKRAGADAKGLWAAYNGFVRVQAPRGQPYGALLRERAQFGRARVLLCLSQAEIAPRWEEAEALFGDVVRAYERGEGRLRAEAAEALAHLGLISLPGRDDISPRPRLRVAAGYYERAVELSRDPDRQALFWSMLGFIHGRLGENAEADAAYRRAAELDPDADDRRRYERARLALRTS